MGTEGLLVPAVAWAARRLASCDPLLLPPTVCRLLLPLLKLLPSWWFDARTEERCC